MLAPYERLLDQTAQVVVDHFRHISPDEAAVTSGARQDREGLVRISRFAQYQNPRAVDVEQRGDLGEHAFRQPLHRFEIEQGGCRFDDDLETAPGFHHALELLVSAQRRGQCGEQLVRGQLGLCLIVIDVVIDDHAPLRSLSRLAGAQNDADSFVLEILADELDKLEPGGVALHDHVEQHHRHIGSAAHELATFRGRIGRQDLKPLAI